MFSANGEVSEWSMVQHWKCCIPQGIASSNLALSATRSVGRASARICASCSAARRKRRVVPECSFALQNKRTAALSARALARATPARALRLARGQRHASAEHELSECLRKLLCGAAQFVWQKNTLYRLFKIIILTPRTLCRLCLPPLARFCFGQKRHSVPHKISHFGYGA